MICHKLTIIQQMTGGTKLSDDYTETTIHGVSIDSRTINPGNLFVPIIKQLDGHDYVEEAFLNGAAASLWQKDHPNPPLHVPLIYVEDCLIALQELAANYRKELNLTVIGVTGSNGKTTTKDMINAVLETTFRVHKTAGNLNSQIGVPLTLLAIDSSTEVAVIEMGMSERGQIAVLSRIVQPDIAIITMIGLSHLATLGSREEIAAAKLEILSGMRQNGVLIYLGDEPLLVRPIQNSSFSRAIHTISFGTAESNDYHASEVEIGFEGGSSFTVSGHKYQIPLLGTHNISNALAAIAVATRLGVTPEKAAEALITLQISGMRMEKIHSKSGFTIINDAWNASPVSMLAAIRTFEELEGYSRKLLIVGDMLELGENEQEFHREIGREINFAKIDYVFDDTRELFCIHTL